MPAKTVAVFTRLTAPDLRTLRHQARLDKTTASQIIRELTEQHLARLRAQRKNAQAKPPGAKTQKRKADR